MCLSLPSYSAQAPDIEIEIENGMEWNGMENQSINPPGLYSSKNVGRVYTSARHQLDSS
jgi:hypothetical protein